MKEITWTLENKWQRDGVGMVVLRVEAIGEEPLGSADVKALARDAEDLLNANIHTMKLLTPVVKKEKT